MSYSSTFTTDPNQQWEPVVWTKTKPVIRPTPPKPKDEEENKPKILGIKGGQQIVQARLAKRWTQQQLAIKLNLDVAVLKKYEQGNIVPNRNILNLINRVLNIKIEY